MLFLHYPRRKTTVFEERIHIALENITDRRKDQTQKVTRHSNNQNQ